MLMNISTKKHMTLLTAVIAIIGTPVYAQEFTKLDCLVSPEMYIDISSPVDGLIQTILVNKTDSVKKGQSLVKLESSVEAAKVDVAQQEALMDNQIYAKSLKLDYAKRKLERIKGLYKQDASSAQEQDDAATELALARADLAQIKLDKAKNELKLSLAKVELELKTIKSPIDGIVVEQYLMPGESVKNQPILQLAKVDPLMVEVVAPASLFGKIRQGMLVEVRPDAPVNSSYQATVKVVDQIINAASGSFTIRLTLPNSDNKLVGGTKCISNFPIKPVKRKRQSDHTNSSYEALPEEVIKLLKE